MPTACRPTIAARARPCAAALAAALALPAAAAGGGLVADADALAWGRVQTRIAYAASPLWTVPGSQDGSGLKVAGVALMGDLYLSSTRATALGGFRATSGLLVGTRGALWGTRSASAGGLLVVDRRSAGLAVPAVHAAELPADGTASTVPYVGIGWSSLTSKAGWSFSADLGLVSRAPGAVVRLGRDRNLDDVVRDLKLAPVLQLGVTYAF